jgi:hypothetical protein
MAPGKIPTRLWQLVTAAKSAWLCRFALVFGVGIGAALAQQGMPGKATSADSSGLRHMLFRWVASSKIFNNVNRDDARAALKVLSDIVPQQRGYGIDSTVDIVDTLAEIRHRLQSHSVELLTLGARDYLELESSNLIVPVLTDSRTPQGGPQYSYVLLVGPSSGATSMASLRGNNILVSARGNGETGMAWLEVLLGKNGCQAAGMHFAAVLRRRGRLRGGRDQSESGEGDESSVGKAQSARALSSHDRKRNRCANGTESIAEGRDRHPAFAPPGLARPSTPDGFQDRSPGADPTGRS